MKSKLHLQELVLSVYFGATLEEQAVAQNVSLDILICFERLPAACHSDKLVDTLCYAALTEALQKKFSERRYRLLEALGYAIYDYLLSYLPEGVNVLRLALTKSPPLESLSHATFIIEA